MKKFFLILFFASCFLEKSLSQDYLPVITIEPFSGNFTTDHLGNIFQYISGDVFMYNLNGKITGTYSSREYGDISYIDATNPMKLLVVFEKFSKAVILDNSMSANTTFNLSLEGIPVISLICTARDGGFWIFDPLSKQLKKINDQMVVTAEGTNLRQVTDIDLIPRRILDTGNWIIMYAADYGFLIFDRYGTYYKTIKSTTANDFQVSSDEIIFKEDREMKFTEIQTGKTRTFILPENTSNDACRVESKRIYVKQLNTLKIYSY